MRIQDQILQQIQVRLCNSHKQFTQLWTDRNVFLRILEAQLWIGSSLSKVHSSTQVLAAPVLDEAAESHLEAWLTWQAWLTASEAPHRSPWYSEEEEKDIKLVWDSARERYRAVLARLTPRAA